MSTQAIKRASAGPTSQNMDTPNKPLIDQRTQKAAYGAIQKNHKNKSEEGCCKAWTIACCSLACLVPPLCTFLPVRQDENGYYNECTTGWELCCDSGNNY